MLFNNLAYILYKNIWNVSHKIITYKQIFITHNYALRITHYKEDASSTGSGISILVKVALTVEEKPLQVLKV